MSIIFSSNNIAELREFSIKERQIILALASNKLITPEKLVINIIKLMVLLPPFFMLVKLDSWQMFIPLIFVLIGYFLVMRPINLYFLNKHIPKAIEQFQRQKKASD